VGGNAWTQRRRAMGKHEQRPARKPATKLPNLRKKLQKGRILSKQAKKK
jgi:hypothetical protein